LQSLFSTITNANFDEKWFIKRITDAIKLRENIKANLLNSNLKEKEIILNDNEKNLDAINWNTDEDNYFEKAKEVGFLSIKDETRRSLIATIIYGLKGMAAYADHAFVLGQKDEQILKFMHEALASTLNESLTNEDLINLIMREGDFGEKRWIYLIRQIPRNMVKWK